MKNRSIFRAFVIALAAFCFSLPALATWNGEFVVSGATRQDLESSNLSFTSGGETMPVTVEREDRNGNVILSVAFDGNSAPAGTLNISGPNRDQAIDTPAAGQGQNIYVDATGPGSAGLLRPGGGSGSPTNNYFPANQVSLGYTGINLTGPGIATSGTVLPMGPGSEFAPLTLDYDVDATGPEVSYSHNLNRGLPALFDSDGSTSNLTLNFSYASYDDDSREMFEEPAGGFDVGYLITALNPAPNDQTGVFFGNFGMQSSGSIDVEFDRFAVGMSWLADADVPGDAFVRQSLSVGYTGWDVDVESLETFEPSFPAAAYFNHRQQSLQQDMIDIGVGATLINPFGANGRFDAAVGATVRLYFNDAELDSMERFNFGNPMEDTRTVRQKADDMNVGLDLHAGLGWNVTPQLRAAFDVNLALAVPSAGIYNPIRGDGMNPGSTVLSLTDITYESRNQLSARVSASYAF